MARSPEQLREDSLVKGGEIIRELGNVLRAQHLFASIKTLTDYCPVDNDLKENPYLPLEKMSLNRDQLEAVLHLSLGEEEIEIGQLSKPVVVHEYPNSKKIATGISLFAILTHEVEAKSEDRAGNHITIQVQYSAAYAIGEDGNTIFVGPVY